MTRKQDLSVIIYSYNYNVLALNLYDSANLSQSMVDLHSDDVSKICLPEEANLSERFQ